MLTLMKGDEGVKAGEEGADALLLRERRKSQNQTPDNGA